MRSFSPVVLALLFVSSSLFADSVQPIPMAPASMEQLAQVADSHEVGKLPRHRRDGILIANSFAESFVPGALAAAPPAVRLGFHPPFPRPGIYPADAGGAVSARFVLGVTNDGIAVHDRSGAAVSYVRLGQFWTDPSLPSGAVYSPRAIYDAANDRWVITTNYFVDDANGRYLIAMSDSGNPAGTWKRYSVPVDDAGNRIADIPHIAQNADSVLLTANTFHADFAYGADIVIIGKSYGSAPPPINAIHFFSTFDLAPLNTSDTSRKVVENEIPRAVVADVIVGTGLRNQVVYSSPQQTSFAFSQPLGPQLGSTVMLASGDTVFEGGVIRKGTTWLVQTVFLPPSRTAIQVWKITGSTVKTYLIESSEAVYAFPSIAVNRFGGALIGYNVFMSTIYPSAGYSYIDPAGNLSAPAILKSGETPYLVGNGAWGDYTTTVVDPADDTSFWTSGIYAIQTNQWATWWGYVPVAGIGRTRASRH